MAGTVMRVTRDARVAAVALATVAETALLTAPPASAAEQCWGEDVCVWDQHDAQGQIYRFSTPADGTCPRFDDVVWPDGTTSQPKTIHNAGSGGLAPLPQRRLFGGDGGCRAGPQQLHQL